MPEQSPTGQFVWYELMTTDPQAAQSFYSSVIGWSSTARSATGTTRTLRMSWKVQPVSSYGRGLAGE